MKPTKLILITALVIIIPAIVFSFRKEVVPKTQPVDQPKVKVESDTPKIISTKPNPLEGAIITASEVIEVTFSHPLENEGEFKLRIEPEVLFKIQLSSDRKTAKIIPQKPYELGRTYTLFIKSDTKFDGVGQWGEEKIFHVNTVRYRGI